MPDKYSLDERLAELTARGIVLTPKRSDSGSYPIGARKAGALQRFLRERDTNATHHSARTNHRLQ
jgi:hypothetical protein